MRFRNSIILLLLSVISCSRINPVAGDCCTEVAIQTCGNTKSHITADGHSVDWDKDDRLYVWAINNSGTKVLDNQEFKIYGGNGRDATFTTTIHTPMPTGQYTYYAVSPKPTSIQNNIATFTVHASQDGRGSGIMISTPANGPELKSAQEAYTGAKLEMNQLLHLLKFSVSDPENKLNGETPKSIELSFTKNVTGQISRNIFTLAQPANSSANGNTITLTPTTDNIYNYATILPTQWDSDDQINARIFTDSRVAQAKPIKLAGRNMAAGHSTPVTLCPAQAGELCRIKITLASNPLGEDLTSLTLTAPDGCKWGDGGTNVLSISDNAGIGVGNSWELIFTDGSAFRNFGGRTVSVKCQSEHVSTGVSLVFPDLSGKVKYEALINVPWLLNDTFDGVGSFSSNDEYTGGFSTGSKDSYSFLNGWTGGRIGASAGKCIRTACRRETSADYDARVESAPLTGTLTKAANLKVEFSYGANNQYGGIAIVTDGNVGQDVHIGYVTSTKGYKSGDDSGVYEAANSFYIKEYSGSYTNTPNDTDYTIHNAPANSTIRISWRTTIEHQAGTTNTTAWLYLDNIKVTIE